MVPFIVYMVALRIRRQFLSYSKPMVGEKCYAAVLPPAGNSRKLQLQWSGPLEIVEIINPAMYKIQELIGKKPRKYLAHRSKLRLARKNGEKNISPTFILPRLPPDIMKEIALDEEFSTLELPKLPSVIDGFYNGHIDHRGQDVQEEASSTVSTMSSKNKDSETESDPEQLFNTHFNLENLQEEEITELLEDEEEVNSAATYSKRNLEPEPEKEIENQSEEDLWILGLGTFQLFLAVSLTVSSNR